MGVLAARGSARMTSLPSGREGAGVSMRVNSVLILVLTIVAATSAQSIRQDLRVGIGEVTLSIAAWGEGDPVILLPGLGTSTVRLEAVAPRIAAGGFRVLAVNPRGIGGSTGPLVDLTLHDYADDLARLVAQMEVGPVHVVGWAWGNRLARCFAADHPDLVATVTLLAAGGKVAPDAEAAAAFARLMEEPNLSQVERREATRIVLFAPTSDPSLWLDVADAWPEGGRAEFEASRATPVEDWWSGGKVPMLVIQGEHDRIAPSGNGRALRDEDPDRIQLIEIADAGHAMVVEQPGAVANAVVQFLNKDR